MNFNYDKHENEIITTVTVFARCLCLAGGDISSNLFTWIKKSGLNPSLLPGQVMFKFISIKETIVGNGNNVFIFLILCVKCAMCLHVYNYAH